jgi:hypothetical protein
VKPSQAIYQAPAIVETRNSFGRFNAQKAFNELELDALALASRYFKLVRHVPVEI